MTQKEITKKRILPNFRHYLQGEIIPRNPSREKKHRDIYFSRNTYICFCQQTLFNFRKFFKDFNVIEKGIE